MNSTAAMPGARCRIPELPGRSMSATTSPGGSRRGPCRIMTVLQPDWRSRHLARRAAVESGARPAYRAGQQFARCAVPRSPSISCRAISLTGQSGSRPCVRRPACRNSGGGAHEVTGGTTWSSLATRLELGRTHPGAVRVALPRGARCGSTASTTARAATALATNASAPASVICFCRCCA